MPDILPTIAEDRLSNFGSADDDEDEEAKVFSIYYIQFYKFFF